MVDKQVRDTDAVKTEAAATARPIIVKHASMLKSPSAGNDNDNKKAAEDAEAAVVRVASSKVILPPKHEEEAAQPAPASDKADTSEAANEPEPEGQTEEQERPSASVRDTVPTTAKGKDAENNDAARAKLAEELAASGEYRLDITERKTGSNAWLTAFIILTLLIAASAYLAIDAEILKFNIALPYEFIR